MDKYESIKLNKTFRYLYAKGESFVAPAIVVYLKPNRSQQHRLGITSGKKIGKAVQRNRARRIIRVAYRALLPQLNGYYDMIIVARTRCVYCSSAQVTTQLKECFQKAKILKDETCY